MDNINDFINNVETYLNSDNNNFEVLLKYLNQVVEKLEDKTVDLTNSVNLYLLGVRLGKKLKDILDTNEELVQKTMKELNSREIEETINGDINF